MDHLSLLPIILSIKKLTIQRVLEISNRWKWHRRHGKQTIRTIRSGWIFVNKDTESKRLLDRGSIVPIPRAGFDALQPRLNIWEDIIGL